MKYLALGLAISCAWLSFFSTQAMEIIDISPKLTNIHFISIDQIIDFIKTHAGVDFKTLALHIDELDQEHLQIFANTIKTMLPLIGNGFDRIASNLSNSKKIKTLQDITNVLGIPAGKELSHEALTFYNNYLTNDSGKASQDEPTILNQNAYNIHESILHAIAKIVMTTITQNKPLHGILLAHDPESGQIAIAAAPHLANSVFNNGFKLGLDLTQKLTPEKGSIISANGAKSPIPLISGNTPAGLSLGLQLLRELDGELTELEHNPNLSDNEKVCISKIHKPVIFLIAAICLVIVAWQFYIGIDKVIHNNWNFSSW